MHPELECAETTLKCMRVSLTPALRDAKLMKVMETFLERVLTVLALVHRMEAKVDLELQIKMMTISSKRVTQQFSHRIGKAERPSSKDQVVLVASL